jgi:plastocyanin
MATLRAFFFALLAIALAACGDESNPVSVDRAPVVTAPATASVAEGQALTVTVTAADPDGSAISSLTASGLPAGATFTPVSGNTSGTLTWTPATGDAGAYTVTFTAVNALSGSASTVITVSTPGDQAPVVTAPPTAAVDENEALTVNVTVTDPDGDGITSLTASPVPAGAVFTAGLGNMSGTLTWTPTFTQSGSYTVTFTATNALSGSASTVITVTNVLELNSGNIPNGGTYQHTFANAGTYPYHCVIHGTGMAGTVVVAGGQPASASVSIGNNFYSPASVSVAPGGTVTWTNNGSTHTVTSN